MKINLKNAVISGFQNLGENQTIEFDTPGLYGVIGRNLDDGGSNASGKSSFTRALTAGILGTKYIDVNNKEVKNRILGIKPFISTDLEINGKNVGVKRYIGGELSIEVDGQELVGKIDEVQDKFMKIMEISPEHYLHLTHKLQGQSSGFLLMKDAEKKDFLSSFFDTSKIELAATRNEDAIKDLHKKIQKNTEELRYITGSLSVIKTDVDTLTVKVTKYTSTEFLSSVASKKSELVQKEMDIKHLSESSIESLVTQSAEYQPLLDAWALADGSFNFFKQEEYVTKTTSLKKELESLKLVLAQPIIVPGELLSRVKTVESELQRYNTAVLHKKQSDIQIENARKLYSINETKLGSLKPNTCTACGQSISVDVFERMKKVVEDELLSNKNHLNRLLEESSTIVLGDWSAIMGDLKTANDEVSRYHQDNNKDNLKVTISNLQGQLSLLDKELEIKQGNLNSATNALLQLKNSIQSKLSLELSKMNSELKLLQQEISSLEKEAIDAQTLLSTVNKKYSDCLESSVKLEQSMSEINKELTIRSKIGEIFSRNGFIGYIFDGILEEINQEVNENIKQVPVISRLSMYFSPDKTVQKTGAVNKSIVYKIFDNGEEVSYETLSGSEKQSISLSVDVAVDTVLCRRLGVDINYKILDEQFGFVDGENKEALLEFLKTKYHDKIILIVDHGSELNAALDRKITVTKQNGIATVSCQNV